MLRTVALVLLVGCALDNASGPTTTVDGETPAPNALDIQCSGAPRNPTSSKWRHTTSALVAGLGDPHHRGIDVVATTSDSAQVLGGKIAYSDVDKDLEDEDVSLYGCFGGQWQRIGGARTDDDGRFSLSLIGDARLPGGMRDLYVTVDGDGTGAEFLAFVGEPGAPLVVSDIDGTLTESENAYPIALASGSVPAAQPDAATALASAAANGATVVYVSTRGDRFMQDTRDWFASHGFPRGPIRLPPAIITIPGEDTIEAKSAIFTTLSAFDLVAGIGNRATDVAAYTNAGVARDHILIKLPEFTDELSADLAAGEAIGFDLYRALDMPALVAAP